MLNDPNPNDAINAYNLWVDDGGNCPYGKIPIIAQANPNNYLMHHPPTVEGVEQPDNNYFL